MPKSEEFNIGFASGIEEETGAEKESPWTKEKIKVLKKLQKELAALEPPLEAYGLHVVWPDIILCMHPGASEDDLGEMFESFAEDALAVKAGKIPKAGKLSPDFVISMYETAITKLRKLMEQK